MHVPRVLHIVSGDLWAGAEVQLYTLVKSLKSLGVTICVVVLNQGVLVQKLQQAGIDVVVLDEKKLNGFKILLKLVHLIREKRPDVIHTHRIKENILGSFAALIGGGVPSIRTVHGVQRKPSMLNIPRRILYFLNQITGRFIQIKIISVSKELVDKLVENFPRSKIKIIENGIDLNDVCQRASTHANVQKDEKFRIGIVGRLVPVKRIDILIEVACYLLKNNLCADIEILVVGDGPLRKELELQSNKLGVNDIVHFLGHKDEILSHIQNLSVLMMTSNHEGMPMVLLEAMALQVPVIAHSVGGITELLDQGACGILIEGQNPSDYAQAIIRLKENPELRKKIIRRALNRVTEDYSAKNNAQGYLSEYISLVN